MKFDPLPGILVIIFGVLCFFEVLTLGTFSNSSPKFVPGVPVTVLLNETIIFDGQPCRVNMVGFISATGPNNEVKRSKPIRWLFPFDTYTAVIYPDGSVHWELESHIELIPASPDLILCPPSNGG